MTEAEVKAAIASALVYSNGEITLEHILEGIKNNSYFVFQFGESIAVLTVIQYHDKTALRIAAASGSLLDVKEEALDVFERLAADLSCNFVEVVGRRGWVRQLKPFGYNEQYTVVTKAVRNNHERLKQANSKK